MRITSFRFLFVLLFQLTFILPAAAADRAQKQEEATQFVKEVQARSDIRSTGSAPFRLVAQVKLSALGLRKQPSDGTISITWQSPGEWREEIVFPGYSEVRVASQGKLWMARNMALEPLRIYQLHQLMDIRSQWTLHEGESVRDKKRKKEKGSVMSCVELDGEKETKRELCADEQLLLPLRNKPLSSPNPMIPAYEYRDYAPWGDKQYPRLMRVSEDTHLAVEIEVQELTSSPKPDAELFAPPAQAIESDWCENIEPAKLTDNPAPSYPESARVNKQQGFVSLYALIGKDGVPHNLTPVRPEGAAFDDASISAIAHWRYRPAMCGSNPIPFETIIDVAYTLQE
jgi:hypothetical protein